MPQAFFLEFLFKTQDATFWKTSGSLSPQNFYLSSETLSLLISPVALPPDKDNQHACGVASVLVASR